MPFSAKYFTAPGWNGIGEARRLLVLELEVRRFLVHGDQVVALVEDRLDDVVGGLLVHRSRARPGCSSPWPACCRRPCPCRCPSGSCPATYRLPYFLFIAATTSAWSIILILVFGVLARSVTAAVGRPPTQKKASILPSLMRVDRLGDAEALALHVACPCRGRRPRSRETPSPRWRCRASRWRRACPSGRPSW